MKTKSIFITAVAVMLLLTTLNGCDRPIDSETKSTRSSDVETVEDTIVYGEDVYPENEERAEFNIVGDRETDFKEEILKEIEIAREVTTAGRSENYYYPYIGYGLAYIEKFYFPNIKIDEYEMFLVGIDWGGFGYYYSPKEGFEGDNNPFSASYSSGIHITIERPDYEHRISFSDMVKENEEMELTEDGFAYMELRKWNLIYAQIDDVILRIEAPKEMSKDDLRDLMYDVIKSLEVVYTGKYTPPITDEPAPTEEVTLDFAASAFGWEGEFSAAHVQ